MKKRVIKQLFFFIFAFGAFNSAQACHGGPPPHVGCGDGGGGLTLHNVIVDRTLDRIEINGSGLNGASVELAGTPLTPTSSSDPQILIDFDVTIAGIVTGPGNYILDVGGVIISIYLEAAIPDPTPMGCPCESAWAANGFVANSASCVPFNLGTQESWTAIEAGGNYSTSFDPLNIFFDPGNPGNSTSFCAFDDGTLSFPIAEPILNRGQYDDCVAYLSANLCSSPIP